MDGILPNTDDLSAPDEVAYDDAPEGMSKEELEGFLQREIAESLTYINSSDQIAAERQRNLDYYMGQMADLPAPPKRSQVTERTVATYVNMLLPSQMRVFTAAKHLGEYAPPVGADPAATKLATRYVNEVVLRKDNNITNLFYRWFFDADVQKVGMVKAWWETEEGTKTDTYENLGDMEFVQLLQQMPDAEVLAHTAQPMMQQTLVGSQPGNIHSVQLKTKVDKSHCCIDVIPPEEFVISRDARTLEDAVLKSHRTGVFVGTLVKQGYDLEQLKNLPAFTQRGPWNRSSTGQDSLTKGRDTTADPMLREVTVHEGIVRCDYDGTGIKDYYFKAAGGDSKVMLLEIEAYDWQVVFADLCPNPIPHVFFGRCPADDLAEIQKVQTAITRQYLDGLYLSNTPQREVVMDWIIKPDQLMNMAPGAPVLVKQPNAIREIKTADISASALQGLQYFEGVAEQRSGITRRSAGLDADALQKQLATTALLAEAASLGKVEMICRRFADGGVTKLFRGILNILVRYQTFERVADFGEGPVKIDPRQWESLLDADISINTGLGTGSRERDVNFAASIVGMQKGVQELFGPSSPIVNPKHVYNALYTMAEATGLPRPEQYFGDPQDWTPQPPPPQPSPDTVVLAEVEGKKIQAKAASDVAGMESDERIKTAEISSRERIAHAQEETKRIIAAVSEDTKRMGALSPA